ncbi:hypothetical protein HII36_21975 [Nonomuraea sp. NN258]|uniref:hypothetical protein n=1 Tax=Nonomuraea antri TaxID=2730852 RepID=UPI001567FD4E|nr:hypothetical protein [Nonomuraea antri]NRQ34496.1 hypothetical protein [Nonomuraea antri]
MELTERSRGEQLAFVRAGTHILVSKLMLATGLTEGEIARAVMESREPRWRGGSDGRRGPMTALNQASCDALKVFAHQLDNVTLQAGHIIAGSIVAKHQDIDIETLAHVMADAFTVVQETGDDGGRTLFAVVYDLLLRGGSR